MTHRVCIPVGPDTNLAALRSTLAAVSSAEVVFALEWPHAVLRPVHGLPSALKARDVQRVLATSPARFLPADYQEWYICPPRRDADGRWLAAAWDAALERSLLAACADLPVRRVRIVPAGPGEAPRPDATAPFTKTIDLRGARSWLRTRAAGMRRVACVALAVAGVGTALLRPALALEERARRDEHTAMRLRARIARLQAARGGSRALDAALPAVARLFPPRRPILERIALLADALPDSCAITSVQLDGDAVSLSILASDAAAVVASLAQLPELTGVRAAGPIALDASAPTALQRLSLRGRWRDAAGAGRR